MKSRLTFIILLLFIIGGATYGFRSNLGLSAKKEEKVEKIKLKPSKTVDQTFMISGGGTGHVKQFLESCKIGNLDEAYNLLPAGFRQKVTREEFRADFQNNLITDYIFLSEKEGEDIYFVTVNYSRQDGSNWSAEWTFERPEYEWIVTKISVTQM